MKERLRPSFTSENLASNEVIWNPWFKNVLLGLLNPQDNHFKNLELSHRENQLHSLLDKDFIQFNNGETIPSSSHNYILSHFKTKIHRGVSISVCTAFLQPWLKMTWNSSFLICSNQLPCFFANYQIKIHNQILYKLKINTFIISYKNMYMYSTHIIPQKSMCLIC